MGEVKEEVKAEITEEKPVTVPKERVKKAKPREDFVTRKLKVINNMNNPAKARSLAERVLKNRKAVK